MWDSIESVQGQSTSYHLKRLQRKKKILEYTMRSRKGTRREEMKEMFACNIQVIHYTLRKGYAMHLRRSTRCKKDQR
jgi:hypothetical protein